MKKRTCDNCRALRGLGIDYHCGLEYPVESEKFRVAGSYSYRPVPKVECPKPLTWKAWLESEPYRKE